MKQKFFSISLFLSLIFSMSLWAQELSNDLVGLAMIKDGVSSKRVSSYDKSGGNNDRFTKIADGEKRTIFDVEGVGIINHIWITIAPPPEELNRNDIILRMYWDGNDYPSVESPLGAFFGQGWDESYEFASLPLSATPKEGRGLVSYFAMPFSSGARIEIENQTGKDIGAFYFYVDYVSMKTLPSKMGRFHAWYNKELTQADEEGENEWNTLGPVGKNTSGKENYLIADIKGKGHFVGVNYYVHSPTPMWYGEGDDMIFIDGDTEPTLNGTGTEDYFNTSWCPKTLFSHPYFGYARVNDDFGWLGRTHVYRFHISDPIYFNKSLKFTIEHGHNNVLTLDLASVAYWYQENANPVPEIPGKDVRAPMPFIMPQQVHKWRHEWRESKGSADTLWGNER
jgi:D-arabinan exo alpha-(1,3)/(1,5)-arabinofuranosidase (non-reducing end)